MEVPSEKYRDRSFNPTQGSAMIWVMGTTIGKGMYRNLEGPAAVSQRC